MELEEALQHFGIKHKEARIYLAALELGESSPKQLASKSEIKRTSLYEILPKLFQKGLLLPVVVGKRRFLVPEDPQKLIQKCKQNLVNLENMRPEFLALFNKNKEKPKVFFFEGLEGIKKVYEDILAIKKNVRAFIGTANINKKLLKYLKTDYEKVRMKNQIFVRNIANEDINIDKKMPQGEEFLRENRIISKKRYPINLEIVIFGNKVGYMTIRQDSQPIALLVENYEIAESMRSIFEIVWRIAKKIKYYD